MGPQVTSKHLQGVTELTLLADVKPGLIPALDSCSYETRLGLVMRTLTGLRASSREHSPIRPFSDAVERIQEIHSFRLAVIQPKPGEGVTKRLMLAVGFDGGWEQYIRRVWRDLGPLLDVMFCNTTDYKSAFDHSFQDYVAWIRSKQVEAGFFYNASAHTVTDLQYLRQLERTVREGRDPASTDAAVARMTAKMPEQLAAEAAALDPGETVKLGLTALSALYRLTDYYPPDGADGGYLLRASHELLKEFRTSSLPAPVRAAYKQQIEWFEDRRPPAASGAQPPVPAAFQANNVQGGIVEGYDGEPGRPNVNHGCVLLMQVTDPGAAGDFLRALKPSHHGAPPVERTFTNIAFTAQGLQRLGLPPAAFEQFPKEFREGMEARADLLGDLRCNHPRNWSLPRRNWPAASGDERVQLSTVDIVVQLRLAGAPLKEGDHEIVGNPDHPLAGKLAQVADLAAASGVRLLAVETLLSVRNQEGKPVGHVNFVDGISQPRVAGIGAPTPPPAHWDDTVAMGEILCGYRNDAGDPPAQAASEYLDDGSFLVLRKLSLDMPALNAFLAAQAGPAGMTPDELAAKIMGRTRAGAALTASATTGNDFDYSDADNAAGKLCPFQSHARRANPRTGKEKPKVPRIMRRGMSYGPPGAGAAERGLMFMAYNASIAEQFEVIQRWLAGANSSGAASAEADPLLGVPQPGDPRTFRFQHAGKVVRVDLDAGQPPGTRPFARLEWGAYLFAPSLPALEKIAALAHQPRESADAAQGETIVKTLLYLESVLPAETVRDAWKAYLEDLGSKEKGYSNAIWAAIRGKFGGVLWTPYGVLVAHPKLVDFVFTNRDLYSVEGCEEGGQPADGYLQRTRSTIGEIYLGLDAGPAYEAASAGINAELMRLDGKDAFERAREYTLKVLRAALAGAGGEVAVDLKTGLTDPVLAALCAYWFGLPDGKHVMSGGWDWTPGHAARCPGDFTAPSRYIFQPNPGPAVKQYAERQGQGLREATRAFVKEMRPQAASLPPLARAIFGLVPDDDRLASTLIGVMMGFLPTVDGNFRLALLQWLADGSLWRLQESLRVAAGASAYEKAVGALLVPLKNAMQRRPVPDIVWRTAKLKHDLGPVAVQRGEKIAIGIVSATQHSLEEGRADVMPVFGGARVKDGPTHACPGYAAGMGVLLGMVSGLLEAGRLKPAPLPLTVYLS